MKYKIEGTVMGDGRGDWGLMLELNGIWYLHNSYRTRKEAEAAVIRLGKNLTTRVDPWHSKKENHNDLES